MRSSRSTGYFFFIFTRCCLSLLPLLEWTMRASGWHGVCVCWLLFIVAKYGPNRKPSAFWKKEENRKCETKYVYLNAEYSAREMRTALHKSNKVLCRGMDRWQAQSRRNWKLNGMDDDYVLFMNMSSLLFRWNWRIFHNRNADYAHICRYSLHLASRRTIFLIIIIY